MPSNSLLCNLAKITVILIFHLLLITMCLRLVIFASHFANYYSHQCCLVRKVFTTCLFIVHIYIYKLLGKAYMYIGSTLIEQSLVYYNMLYRWFLIVLTMESILIML